MTASGHKRRILFRSQANLEIAEIAEWYAARGRGLAAEFLRVLDATVAAIQRNPVQYPKVEGDVRRALMRRFPYGIIFSVSDDDIVILGCFHGRRDPKHWRSRG